MVQSLKAALERVEEGIRNGVAQNLKGTSETVARIFFFHQMKVVRNHLSSFRF